MASDWIGAARDLWDACYAYAGQTHSTLEAEEGEKQIAMALDKTYRKGRAEGRVEGLREAADMEEDGHRHMAIRERADQIERGEGGAADQVPSLDDPCTSKSGRHSIYVHSGPGGKRTRREGWQCCETCGANGPMEEGGADGR